MPDALSIAPSKNESVCAMTATFSSVAPGSTPKTLAVFRPVRSSTLRPEAQLRRLILFDHLADRRAVLVAEHEDRDPRGIGRAAGGRLVHHVARETEHDEQRGRAFRLRALDDAEASARCSRGRRDSGIRTPTAALPRTSRPRKSAAVPIPTQTGSSSAWPLVADRVIERKRGLERDASCHRRRPLTSHDVGHHCGGQIGELLDARLEPDALELRGDPVGRHLVVAAIP